MLETADKSPASATPTLPQDTPSHPPREEAQGNNNRSSSSPVQSQENVETAQSREWNLLNPNSSNRQEPPAEYGRADKEPFVTNPFAPPSLIPQSGRGGMIFDGRGTASQPGPRWGGDGFLPPMGAPPGARFGPVVPGSVRPPTRCNPIGKLDNDEFLPPGMGDDIPK